MELVDVLDDLSYRSSRAAQLAALEHIHGLLADVCVRTHDPSRRPYFLQQQNDFETNIVSRILNSGILSASTVSRTVDEIRAKASTSSTVADVTSLALSALQGMALIHSRSKTYLGRRLGIQTLLDLLTALRHASVNPDDPDTTVTSGIDSSDSKLPILLSPLSCSVIDTLLCLLVDSPSALRVFEECNGLEVVVRTLKKVTGQSVRMKCLEFLYFYLQDEDIHAVTGITVTGPPVGFSKPDTSPLAAQPTPKPTRTSKPSASKTRFQSSPTSNHALQTPQRPKTKPGSASETRPRTRTPMERTVSGDSTHSALSSRSDATDASAGPEYTRTNRRDSVMRSVSRSSTCSAASTTSNVTDSSVKSVAKPQEVEREPKRPFPRLSVMPSLSYSSSTVSSTSTNQTLEHAHQADKHLRIHPQTPSQTRSTTPNSLTQECFVPLPESPAKAGTQDVHETPKPKRRIRDEETPGVKVRDRKAQETPRAKARDDQDGRRGLNAFQSSTNIFPALGPHSSEEHSSNPFKNPDAPKIRPTAPTLVTLSLLKGEVDYEPESPKKQAPFRTVGDEVNETIKAHRKTGGDSSSKPTKDSALNPFKAPTPKPSNEDVSDSKEPASPTKPAKHRPRASEILPRPVPSRPVPRNVSTPTCSTPTTPVGTAPSTPVSGREIGVTGVEASLTPPITDTTTPGLSTPARTKKVAIIPGGGRLPGRSEGGSELRKSLAVGAKELKKSQSNNEGLRRSQGNSDGLRRSHLSTEGLRSQPSSEILRKSPEDTQKVQSGNSDTKQDVVSRPKRSTPSTPVPPRGDGARRAVRDGLSRVRRDGVDSEGRSSGEMERNPGSDGGKRSSMEESPSRIRSVLADGKMVRTSAEKKELLGAWLGNVDALVEGVQRAGVWGLR